MYSQIASHILKRMEYYVSLHFEIILVFQIFVAISKFGWFLANHIWHEIVLKTHESELYKHTESQLF